MSDEKYPSFYQMKNKFNLKYNMPEPVCLYKWAWSSIRLSEQTTNSCHRTDEDNIDVVNFQNFHNTPIKLKTRATMLEGKWPGHGCEYCKKIEDVNGLSDRIEVNSDPFTKLVPTELLRNNRAISITPTIVEIYFSNLCNMSCIYCSEEYSSVWENENKKYNTGLSSDPLYNISRKLKKADYPNILNEFWKWLENNHATLQEYNILGGEPFFQPELETNIDFFLGHPSPQLNLKVFSNLKVDKNKFKRMLDKIQTLLDKKHLRSVTITASLDCWGPEQEYVRTGLNLKQWEENFNLLLTDYPQFKIEIHSTVCNLTINTLPELLNRIEQWNKIRKEITSDSTEQILHTSNIVSGNNVLQPDIFPDGFFDTAFSKIADAAEDNSYSKNQLISYKDSINNSNRYKPELINELKNYLDNIDMKRGLNWRPIFPWLDNFDFEAYNK